MKRNLAVLLVLVILLASFAGCAGKSGSSTTNNNATASDADNGSSTTAVKEEGQSSPVVFVVRGVNNVENKSGNDTVYAQIKEKSGIDFKFTVISVDEWSEKVNLMLASSDDFDLMNITESGGNWSQFLQKKAIVPMNDYLKYIPALQKLWSDNALKACKDAKGDIYALPRQELFYKQNVPAIRKDWLQALGMQSPTTLTELEAYFQGIVDKDLNGNGDVKDEIPVISFLGNELTVLRPYFMGFTGDRYMDENNQIVPWYKHKNAYMMLETLHRWYEKGYLYKDYATMDVQQGFDLITANRIGMWTSPFNAGVGSTASVYQKNPNCGIYWESLNNLTDFPDGGSNNWGSNPANMSEIVLSKTSKNPISAFKLLNWMFESTDNYMLCIYGIEGTNWKYMDSTKKTFTKLDTDSYTGFYRFCEWFDFNVFPSEAVEQNNYKSRQMADLENKINSESLVEEMDFFVPYNLAGTKAETLTNDADTLIKETCAKIIIGEEDEKDWNAAVESAWKNDGSIRSEVWTQQYNTFVGK